MSQAGDRRQPSVLLVEDEPRARRALAAILKGWGFAVRTAETVEQAIALLSATPTLLVLVVLDLTLPDATGVDVLRHVRENTLELTVAVVSGAKESLLAEAHEFKPDAVFEKPLSLMQLRNWLANSALACDVQLPPSD